MRLLILLLLIACAKSPSYMDPAKPEDQIRNELGGCLTELEYSKRQLVQQYTCKMEKHEIEYLKRAQSQKKRGCEELLQHLQAKGAKLDRESWNFCEVFRRR